MAELCRVRQLIAMIAALAATATMLTACTRSDDLPAPEPSSDSPAPARPDLSRAVLGPDGARAEVDAAGVHMTVTAPSGAAPVGTALAVAETATPEPAFEPQVGAGPAFSVVLGNGIQPKEPISLEFQLAGQPGLTEKFNDEVRPVVRVISHDGTEDLAAADWNPQTQVVTATAAHLSIFQVIAVNIGTFAREMATSLQRADGQDMPCEGRDRITVDDTEFTLTTSDPDSPLTGCFGTGADAGQLRVNLSNGTNQFFGVRSNASGSFKAVDVPQSDELVIALLQKLFANQPALLAPKSRGRVTMPTRDATITLKVDPAALQWRIVFAGAGMYGIGPGALADALNTSTAAWDCMASASKSTSVVTNFSTTEFREMLVGLADCGLRTADLGGGAGGKNHALSRLGVLLSLVTTLPDQLLANVAGLMGELTGLNNITLTIAGATEPEETKAPTGPLQILPRIFVRNIDGYGTELGPNHFRMYSGPSGHFVSLGVRWSTSNGKAVSTYCDERSFVTNSAGAVVWESSQQLGGGCTGGGGWKFKIEQPGAYTYNVEVTPEGGETQRGSIGFTVDP